MNKDFKKRLDTAFRLYQQGGKTGHVKKEPVKAAPSKAGPERPGRPTGITGQAGSSRRRRMGEGGRQEIPGPPVKSPLVPTPEQRAVQMGDMLAQGPVPKETVFTLAGDKRYTYKVTVDPYSLKPSYTATDTKTGRTIDLSGNAAAIEVLDRALSSGKVQKPGNTVQVTYAGSPAAPGPVAAVKKPKGPALPEGGATPYDSYEAVSAYAATYGKKPEPVTKTVTGQKPFVEEDIAAVEKTTPVKNAYTLPDNVYNAVKKATQNTFYALTEEESDRLVTKKLQEAMSGLSPDERVSLEQEIITEALTNKSKGRPEKLIADIIHGKHPVFKAREQIGAMKKKAHGGRYRTGGLLPRIQQAHRRLMVLLDHEGREQMYIQGGELIFSRPSTKEILRHAAAGDLEKLGRAVVEERIAQQKRDARKQ